MPKAAYDLPDFEALKVQYGKFREDIQAGRILSAMLWTVTVLPPLYPDGFGKSEGVKIEHNVDERDLFSPGFGDIICEVADGKVENCDHLYSNR